MHSYEFLCGGTAESRLRAAEVAAVRFPEPVYEDVNGHIHTTFSFSPYSPAAAVYAAKMSGLKTAGIMDHDTISGAAEFISAGEIFNLPVTVGLECRVSMAKTPYSKRRTNNPDQDGCTYMSMHGVPHGKIGALDACVAPLRKKRGQRNREMVYQVNRKFGDLGLELDYDADVLPLSEHQNGGSVTERHISRALAEKIIATAGKGAPVVIFLRDKLGVSPTGKIAAYLSDEANPHYIYDLIGVIKSDIISGFYIPADEELLPIGEAVDMARSFGALACLPYLGDITSSVTGDKRAQPFEDSYLDEWIEFAKRTGFQVITYMPSRNTDAQLERLRRLIAGNGLWEISGEDINTSRQPFVCERLRDAKFEALRVSAYALIEHERRGDNLDDGFFGKNSLKQWPDMAERAAAFASAAKVRLL